MKTFFQIIFVFLIGSNGYGQETSFVRGNAKNIQFNTKIGLTYQGFIGGSYIKREKDNREPYNPEKDQYDGFTKKATLGFQVGIIADFRIHKNLHLSTGFLFAQRKSIFEGDRDSVLTYGTPTSIHDIVKYEYQYNNIEFPILFTLKLKKLGLHAGVNLILVSFYKSIYSYIPNPHTLNDKTEKTLGSIELSNTIYPTLQMSYNLKVKKIAVNPFLGIDIGKNKSLYFQGGIMIPITYN